MLLEIWNTGHCAVLLDWRIPLGTAIEMMKEADVQKCFIDENIVRWDTTLDSFGIDYTTFKGTGKTAACLPAAVYQKFREDYSPKEAIVLYSSGTTGKAKGIILSHYAINTNADAIIDYMKPDETDCIHIAKTLSHSSTLVGELLVALKTKTNLVIAPTIMPPRYVMSNIGKYHVTSICINPTLLAMFAEECNRGNYDITSLRNIYVCGSLLSDSVYKKAHETFKGIHIRNMYGLSEAAPRVTAQRNGSVSNSAGTPIRGVEIVIVDEQGMPVGTGRRGIIHVKTPSLFQGYISGKEKLASLYKDWLNTADVCVTSIHRELLLYGRVSMLWKI